MICKKYSNAGDLNYNKLYNYSFIEDGKVLLENNYDIFSISYEDWLNEYYVVDKWHELNINNMRE